MYGIHEYVVFWTGERDALPMNFVFKTFIYVPDGARGKTVVR
jgi:hypothetical protein